MSVDALKAALPDYAKDTKLNLGSLTTTSSLTEQQLWGTVLVSALASRNAQVVREIADDAADHLSAEAFTAAKAAASIMAMNNIYYRSTHLLSDDTYETLRTGLRMNIIGKPGVEKADFELWCLAVSAINGCGKCLDSHEKVLRDAGMPREQIQEALKIAAVVHAAALTLESEDALAPATV